MPKLTCKTRGLFHMPSVIIFSVLWLPAFLNFSGTYHVPTFGTLRNWYRHRSPGLNHRRCRVCGNSFQVRRTEWGLWEPLDVIPDSRMLCRPPGKHKGISLPPKDARQLLEFLVLLEATITPNLLGVGGCRPWTEPQHILEAGKAPGSHSLLSWGPLG